MLSPHKDSSCPLCHSFKNSEILCPDTPQKLYYDCSVCGLIFLNKSDRLSLEEEKKRYLNHNNDVNDPGYQNFVSDIINGIKSIRAPKTKGLDFGAGTGSVVSFLLEKEKYEMTLYDPFFHNDQKTLTQKYDFIVSCEVIEHLHNPNVEFERLFSLLNSNSPLVVKTDLYNEKIDFKNWYYRNDPTHVVFYREKTYQWLKEYYRLSKIEKLSERTWALWS